MLTQSEPSSTMVPELPTCTPAGWEGLDRSRYRSARPWPHLVIDGIFPSELVAAAEGQELAPGLLLPEHRSHRQVKAESPRVSGPAARQMLFALTSPAFVSRLAGVTAIEDLRADPSFCWGGIHVGRPGAFQAVHTDFPRHPVRGWYHRIAALLYLNSEWTDDYGGQLELWTPDVGRCVTRIGPAAGRLVLLETGTHAVHGVPHPVRCPTGRARLTLACHYYSDRPPPDQSQHSLIRRPRRPEDSWRTGYAAPGDAVTVLRRRIEATRTRLRGHLHDRSANPSI